MSAAIVTKLKVAEFEGWKTGYDAGEGMRRELKVRGVMVLRDEADPTHVTIITQLDSVADAKAMIASPRWQEAAKAAGTKPEVMFATVMDQKTY